MWAGAMLVLVACSVGFVKHKDHDNRFCIACHLHQDIYRHTVTAPPTTLAAGHYRADRGHHPERCFTCHSGEGVVGWSQVTLLSAWDAARWVAGDRHEPTSMRLPLTNQACLKCHAAHVGLHPARPSRATPGLLPAARASAILRPSFSTHPKGVCP